MKIESYKRELDLIHHSWKTWPLFTVLAVVSVATQAASTPTLNVNGLITSGTCNLSAGDTNRVIKLDQIYKGDLPANGAAGIVPFSLTVNNCAPGLSNATFTFSGTPDPNDSLRYRNSGTSTGVAIELTSSDGQTIGADGTDNARTVVISGGNAVLNLRASYWRVSGVALNAGTVNALAAVNTSYN